jgi:hypothetical protein
MTGDVISKPSRAHPCAPGWKIRRRTDLDLPFTHTADPPTSWEYPKGTVWGCGCGRTWVSTGPPARNAPGFVSFRREGRWERRRRERRTR